MLQLDLVVVEECLQQSCAGTEPAEDGALADARGLSHGVHAHRVDPALGEQALRRFDEQLAIARGIAARLGLRLREGEEWSGHRIQPTRRFSTQCEPGTEIRTEVR
ncbi:hypothetical protein GCM10009648_37770 [Tsukamurella spumae]